MDLPPSRRPMAPLRRRDLLGGDDVFVGRPRNYVELDPERLAAHVFRVKQPPAPDAEKAP